MTLLKQKYCIPCKGGMSPMSREAVKKFLSQVSGWNLKDDPSPQIERNFKFKNFKEAVAFVNKVSEVAESEGHHPNILLHNWNKVRLTFYTHAIGGLSENDFIMAAKVNEIASLCSQ